MISGATWTPAYDLRLDTQTDSMSCTYYGRVSQSTTEDWEGAVECVRRACFAVTLASVLALVVPITKHYRVSTECRSPPAIAGGHTLCTVDQQVH